MSKSRRPEFLFDSHPYPAHVQPLVDVTPAEQLTQPTMRVDDTQVNLRPRETAVPTDDGRLETLGYSVRGLFDRIVAEWQQAKLTITLALAARLVIGLPILGWGVWPVEWTGGNYTHLSPQYQEAVVDMAADLAAYDPASPTVARFTYLYTGVELRICDSARQTLDPSKQQRLRYLSYRTTGSDCNMVVPPTE